MVIRHTPSGTNSSDPQPRSRRTSRRRQRPNLPAIALRQRDEVVAAATLRGTPSCPKVVFPTIPDMGGAGGEPLIVCCHPRSPQGERTSASIPSRPLPDSSEAQRNPLGDRPPSGIGVGDRRPSCPTPDGHPRHQDAEPSQPSPHTRRLHSRTNVLLRDFDQVDKEILISRPGLITEAIGRRIVKAPPLFDRAADV
jgi:hypothetical protein